MLYHILNILYQKAHTVAAFYIMCNVFNSVFGNAFTFINSIVGFLDGYNYFTAVKVNRRNAQMTPLMKWFCRKSGKSKFTAKDIAAMKATAALKAADRNPYSWNMEFYEYPDGSGYEGRFTKCGICVLMKELGLYDLTPALCHLDYTMSEAGGVTNFVRQYTLASGGPYCDCGYKKKG